MGNFISTATLVKSWQYFRTHGIPLNSMSNALSYDVVRFKIEVGVDAKFICKNVTHTHATFLPYSGPAAGLAVAMLDEWPRPTSPRTASGVNMLGLCDHSNLLFILSAKERRAVFKLLWGLVTHHTDKARTAVMCRYGSGSEPGNKLKASGQRTNVSRYASTGQTCAGPGTQQK